MAFIGEDHPSRPEYGRRVPPNVVDDVAAAEPERPFAYAPRSEKPEDGWESITYKQLATAVNCVARIAAETVKPESKEAFPTIAYIGPNDIRYVVIMLAAIKAGCQALFISPRNSEEGQLSLLERTKCGHLWYAETFERQVQPWLSKKPMKSSMIASFDAWVKSEPEPFHYNVSFEQARFRPLAVLHTSGSTGIPKAIVQRLGAVAIADGQRSLPDHHGSQALWKSWADQASRFFIPMPLYHAAGLDMGVVTLGIFYGIPIALPPANQPLTADLVVKCLKYAGVDAAVLPPSIVEDMTRSDEGLSALKNLNIISLGGGSVSEAIGDILVKNRVGLTNVIGSTELMPYALYRQNSPELWRYFIINSDQMGVHWESVDREENIFEMQIRRKDANDPLDQPCFYTFPDLKIWSTGDLYTPHPSLPDHWLYRGRTDDVIVLSTGEKLNPVTIESAVRGHPDVKGAMVVGQGRFQPALIVEPNRMIQDDKERKALISKLWPIVDHVNMSTVAHGRIARQLVVLSDPNLPFPRGSKGTVQRRIAQEKYKDYINSTYDKADDVEAVPLDFGGQDALTQSILDLLTSSLGIRDVKADTDFFTLGVDSQQVLAISRILQSSAKAAGASIPRESLAPRAIYANPTAASLATYLLAQTQEGSCSRAQEEASEIHKTKQLVEKYAADLPAPNAKKHRSPDTGLTVLLTGSTGSLGAYLLDRLCQAPNVKKIVALNRGIDGGSSRQGSISSARGLGTDFTKVEFLESDLSKPGLGLETKKYSELLSQADRIIHNAWPVNFNLSVTSFEPHIRGVRQLVNFSHTADKLVPIIFLSTIGTAQQWSSQDSVPETRLDDYSVASMGYGRSKLAGGEILQAASDISGVPAATIRVGQVAGPRGLKGMWNKQEFIPSLIASSLYLGALPAELAKEEVVDWVPIEDMTSLILDIAGITTNRPVSELSGYYHGVTPEKTTWGQLAPILAEFYKGRIKEIISIEDWIEMLKASESTTTNLDRNPAVKLIDIYEGMVKGARAGMRHVNFDMTETAKYSPTAAGLRPLTPDLLRNWCEQWAF